jgi:hypothetical protein
VEIRPGAYERILRYFLRVLRHPQRRERCAVDRRLVANDKLVKGVSVGLPGQPDQLLVRHTTNRLAKTPSGWMKSGFRLPASGCRLEA